MREISSTSSTAKCREEWQVRMLDTIFILYADHEFNASTFAARVTASTLADMYAAATSACGTLKGPLHGGANEESMYMLDEIGTAGQGGEVDDGCAREEGEDHGLRPSRLQKRATRACRSCARSRAITASASAKKIGCRFARNSKRRWSARKASARTSISTPRRFSRCSDSRRN